MSITDELREYANTRISPNKGVLLAIADRIDAEHERGMADAYLSGTPTDGQMAEHGWVRLPKDADGVPILVGDRVRWLDEPRVSKVDSLTIAGDGWWVYSHGCGVRSRTLRHYHAPTVEDVLYEIVGEACSIGTAYAANDMNGYEMMEALQAIIAEYAKRLTLAEEEDA